MKKTLKHIHAHLIKHQYKYLGLAALCKIMILGLFAIPILQTIQTIYAQTPERIIFTTTNDGGRADPSNTKVKDGGSVSIYFYAHPGYELDYVTVNGENRGKTNPVQLTNITQNYEVYGHFVQLPTTSYTITTKVIGVGGTISPKDPPVPAGSSQTINIIADEGYGIQSLIVDKNPVPLTSSYTFDNVTSNHEIAATFAPLPHTTQDASVQCQTTTSPQQLTVTLDTPIQRIQPENKIQIIATIEKGIDLGKGTKKEIIETIIGPAPVLSYGNPTIFDISSITAPGKYTLRIEKESFINGMLTTNPINIPFTVNCQTYTITTTIKQGEGTVNPSSLVVPQGDNVTIFFAPKAGYTYDKIEVTVGDSMTTINGASSITLNNITNNYIINVYFKAVPTSSSSSQGGGGSSVTLTTDNCPQGDYSPSYYDGDCGTQPPRKPLLQTQNPQTQNINDQKIPQDCYTNLDYLNKNFVLCLGLEEKAKMFKALNDLFYTNITAALRATRDDQPTATYSLTKILQSIANQLTQINQRFTNTFTTSLQQPQPKAR